MYVLGFPIRQYPPPRKSMLSASSFDFDPILSLLKPTRVGTDFPPIQGFAELIDTF